MCGLLGQSQFWRSLNPQAERASNGQTESHKSRVARADGTRTEKESAQPVNRLTLRRQSPALFTQSSGFTNGTKS